MDTRNTRYLIITGYFGLAAAILVGCGEFLLHFDPTARYAGVSDYAFMLDIPVERITLGHFLAVTGIPLYIIGCFHIYLMLRPVNQSMGILVLVVGAYGFIIGGIWMGSRANIAAIVQLQTAIPQMQILIELYQLRYESLLTVIRSTTVILSFIMVGMILTGKSLYPRWIALINPAFLIILSFLLFKLLPSIGKYVMPVALNLAFCIFFAFSIWVARQKKPVPKEEP